MMVQGKGAHAGGPLGGSKHGHPGDSRGAQSGALVRRRRGLRETGEGEAGAPGTRTPEGLACPAEVACGLWHVEGRLKGPLARGVRGAHPPLAPSFAPQGLRSVHRPGTDSQAPYL